MMYPQAVSHGNVLSFTPPGFKQTLNVKFPDCRLAVCEKCKKNYKTRDMCRVRNAHTEEPWTTAYICITLDDSCTHEGKYVDKPLTVRMVQWQPYCVKQPFSAKTPVCAACKKTNRTRSFCRERHQHRQLPWCTVYVILSALESTDPSTIVAAPSRPAGDGGEEGKKKTSDQIKKESHTSTQDAEQNKNDDHVKKEDEKKNDTVKTEDVETNFEKPLNGAHVAVTPALEVATEKNSQETAESSIKEPEGLKKEVEDTIPSTPVTSVKTVTDGTTTAPTTPSQMPQTPGNNEPVTPITPCKSVPKGAKKKPVKTLDDFESDDINAIDEGSRTFLAKVSCRSTTIHWLEMVEYDSAAAAAAAASCAIGGMIPMMNPTQPGGLPIMMVGNGDPNQAQAHAQVAAFHAMQNGGANMMAMNPAAAAHAAQYYAQMGMAANPAQMPNMWQSIPGQQGQVVPGGMQQQVLQQGQQNVPTQQAAAMKMQQQQFLQIQQQQAFVAQQQMQQQQPQNAAAQPQQPNQPQQQQVLGQAQTTQEQPNSGTQSQGDNGTKAGTTQAQQNQQPQPNAAAMAVQQQQWHAHMLYQQQLYHQQQLMAQQQQGQPMVGNPMMMVPQQGQVMHGTQQQQPVQQANGAPVAIQQQPTQVPLQEQGQVPQQSSQLQPAQTVPNGSNGEALKAEEPTQHSSTSESNGTNGENDEIPDAKRTKLV